MTNLLPGMLLLIVLAQTTATAPPPAEDPAHDALRKLKATMEKALNERDLDTIVAHVHPDVVFTTMNGDVCRGPEQIRAYFNKMLNAPGHIVKDVKVSFEADALTILHGGDTGIAYGKSKDHYELTNGKTFDIAGRWTCTMVKSGDRWLIASFHYSANVFSNPILDRMKTALYQVGIGAVLAGMIAGFLIARMLARRNA